MYAFITYIYIKFMYYDFFYTYGGGGYGYGYAIHHDGREDCPEDVSATEGITPTRGLL